MAIIRQRRVEQRNYRVNDYDRQRLEEVEQERCGVCMDRWPASVMTTEDGMRRCPDCLAVRTEAVKAEIRAYDAERVGARQTRPQRSRTRLRETAVPHIRVMEDANGNRVLPETPLSLTRGGAAVSLVIKGGGFAATDTFSYSDGISDNSAPALSDTTQWTLSLVASGGMTPGEWHVTFNNHTYRNILRVR